MQEYVPSNNQSSIEVAENGYILRTVNSQSGVQTVVLCPGFTNLVQNLGQVHGNLSPQEAAKTSISIGV